MEDVNAHKCNQHLIGHAFMGESSSHTGNNQLAYRHASGTEDEKIATTPLLHEPKTGKSRANVHNTGDNRHHKRVLNAGVLEVRCPVVKDEVDTRELL